MSTFLTTAFLIFNLFAAYVNELNEYFKYYTLTFLMFSRVHLGIFMRDENCLITLWNIAGHINSLH